MKKTNFNSRSQFRTSYQIVSIFCVFFLVLSTTSRIGYTEGATLIEDNLSTQTTVLRNEALNNGDRYIYDQSGKLIYMSSGQSYYYDDNGNLVRKFKSLSFDGTNQVPLDNVAVNTAKGAKNSVEFWMYWNGIEGEMPFSWSGSYALWFAGGYFGFNTGEANVLGIPSTNLKNKWVHVTATFYNGVPDGSKNELYINGIKQNLVAGQGTTTAARSVTSAAFISGTGDTTIYRFTGRIGDVRIWNFPLTQSDVQANMYKVLTGTEKGLAGYWKLADVSAPSTSLRFDGTNQVPLDNVAVNTAKAAKNSVEFWMYWNGIEGEMPFSWSGSYALWFAGGYFGFNTGEANVLGIPSTNLKNKWVHVTATFYNGVPDGSKNELYINGIKQNLVAGQGTTTAARSVTSAAFISGTGDTTIYRFTGRIGDVRIWNFPLTQSDVQANMYRVVTGAEAGLVGYWKGYVK
ncbi:LamG domain-containing protein [Paenibacillus sp. UMB4589-SE434]|uniref:LamG domain-containing protein n=1 Tax=Paenibacillus sp. UMB4589-SE434 TaxID=3046314 RepID=UPI00254E5F4C|nr:LamG domain-containing protein [Paenibacillus sp. UMB4589-SE434]MDK8183742.1 LamG domain-containing protein [Paenibacillus sp. UMB4589-SE434]